MSDYNDRNYSYSWHQSHDQATILLMVPYETHEEDLVVTIDRNYLVAGVQGKPPVVKGRLYSTVDTTNSMWQLESSRASRLPARERTTSATSTVSSQSSYAFVSDPEISSSFAASLEGVHMSDAEDAFLPSPGLSSPSLSSADELASQRRRPGSNTAASRSVSPSHVFNSIRSSYSSLDSLHHAHSGKLLTLHLEKEQSIIWPSLIVGPVPDTFSPPITDSLIFNTSHELEHKYNMDPTSLALLGLEYFDIRKDKEEAFEYFMRAWHQARNPSATMRLVSQYVPLQVTSDLSVSQEQAPRGTLDYYAQCLGGKNGLARLYLEAGLLHLEGMASTLLSSSYSSLSSIRVPLPTPNEESGTEAWKRDREAALGYFEHAHALDQDIEIPALPHESESTTQLNALDLEMPKMDVGAATPESEQSLGSRQTDPGPPIVRRRKKREGVINAKPVDLDDMDSTWYLYVPGLFLDVVEKKPGIIDNYMEFTRQNSLGLSLVAIMRTWNTDFLQPGTASNERRALIILNQPFSPPLLRRLWNRSQWHCCADGGANQLYDVQGETQSLLPDSTDLRKLYMPDLIKGDLDSIRHDVKKYYVAQGVPVVLDGDQNSTDLMKCVTSLQEREQEEGLEYELVILGGLSGRLDQTVHTLSYLHKMRKTRKKVYAITDENVGWVLDSGEHTIKIDHDLLGKTCGLLPVGVENTVLSTSGLKWNITDCESSFDGLMSTSNHLMPGQDVWIKTTRPIWWTVELELDGLWKC
ncbi:hypothetical protein AX15_005302 [Amanita polypyramis BW_CC]|nr:hypothetical protein AX15_005302 [Amanita polypyramis BW_CC]